MSTVFAHRLLFEMLEKDGVLTKRDLDVLYLYFVLRKRLQDIATIFGKRPSEIESSLDRGLARARTILKEAQGK